ASSARNAAERPGVRPARTAAPGRAAACGGRVRHRGGRTLQGRRGGQDAGPCADPAARRAADDHADPQRRGRVQHRHVDDDRIHRHRPRRDRLHSARRQEPAQHRLGHRARPAARRSHRQPARPRIPRAGVVRGARGRLDRAAALAGLQPGRLRHRLRRRAGRPARAARDPAGRDQGRPGIDMTAPGERQVAVPDGLDGERLDAALARMFGLSRSRAAELIGDGMVLIDGRTGSKSDRVLAGDPLQVTLPPPRPAEPPQPVEGLVVLYEDDDIVVVDKPRGVAAHPTPGWSGPTVTGGLVAAGHTVATSGAAERQGVVHRLDANTTGVMVVAKSERAYSALKRAFRERTVDKRYHALVQGHPDPLRGTVDAPIGRHPSGDGRFAVVSAGRPSVTHYDTLEAFRAASLVSVHLETGRTHQIRVHMAALRHPCVGDLLYGADPVLAARLGLTRQWLHAVSLTFAHPADGREVTFTSDYPPDLARALDILRTES